MALKFINELLNIFDAPNNSKSNEIFLSSTIETTMMISKRKQIPPYAVVHQVNWSAIFDDEYQFDSTSKQQLKHDRKGWTIKILSDKESSKLIKLTELYGYEDVGYDKGYRSNTRTITNDPLFSDKLYTRIKQCCPEKIKCDGIIWQICGLNERLRWCKYIKGQKFDMHCDARYERNEKEKSFYTVNIYLNDGNTDFQGGRTLFYTTNMETWKEEVNDTVTASSGVALIFEQYPSEIYHSGEQIYDGIKYLMRTDVMYQAIETYDIRAVLKAM